MYIKHNKIFGPLDLDLTELTVQSSIEEIASQAFQNCTQLKAITIPCVNVIGNRAFSGCTSLQRVAMCRPNTIGEYAFSNCISLQCVAFPDPPTGTNTDSIVTTPASLAYMGNSAFENCYNLETVSLPATIGNIGSYAFWRCNRLTTINLPMSITSIGYGAFFQCNKLTSIKVPPVKFLRGYTFYCCYSLHTIQLPSTIRFIGVNVFNGCSSLKTVTLPPINTITDGLFENCTSLRTIYIPHTVKIIGYLAFNRCYKLASISVYSTLSTIQNMAFADCISLRIIEVLDVPSKKFFKLLIKSTIGCPLLDTVLCYNYMFIKSNGGYVVLPRKSPCKLVSKACWVGKQCNLNVPHLLNIIDEYCGPIIPANQAGMLCLVLNKIL